MPVSTVHVLHERDAQVWKVSSFRSMLKGPRQLFTTWSYNKATFQLFSVMLLDKFSFSVFSFS